MFRTLIVIRGAAVERMLRKVDLEAAKAHAEKVLNVHIVPQSARRGSSL